MALPASLHAQTAATRSFQIGAQPLGEALADFGAQANLQVSIDASAVRGLSGRAVQGTMPAAEALRQLLAGSGFVGSIEGGVVTLAPVRRSADGALQLGPLQVEGQQTTLTAGQARDAGGYDAIYDRDTTTTYMGKDEVERYKGVTSSDLLKGMLGVFSGDPRNGGAIDPSIRGISGPGRVPVIIDGTEQALTVWRGYNGASNRAYIDPSLISGLEVEKGPVSARGVNGSIGGAVVVHTLDADDIIRKGKKFGLEIKLEGGDNSTRPQWPTLLTGQDYRTVPNFPALPNFPYGDPNLTVTPRNSNSNHLFSLGDKAVRVAAAARVGKVDLFGAYAYRTRGNYYSGGDGAEYYSQSGLAQNPGNFVQRMALSYLPGNEVTNTSSETSSWLAKVVWHINDSSYLKGGFRDTLSHYGDILSSRLITGGANVGSIQWPDSRVHTQAYNLDYRLQPDLWWLDLKANVWATHTISATNSLGGFPNAATAQEPLLQNTAVAHNRNDRFGAIASNQFKLGSRLDLLVEGNWQREVLRSTDQQYSTATCGFCQYPRSGHREEYRLNVKSEWRPTSFLKFNAGVTYSGYSATDDLLLNLISSGKAPNVSAITGYKTNIGYAVTDKTSYQYYWNRYYQGLGFDAATAATFASIFANSYTAAVNRTYTIQGMDSFYANDDGQFTRAQNPCLNGAYNSLSGYVAGSCTISSIQKSFTATADRAHNSGSNWAPMVSGTLYLGTTSRIYARYAEAYRYPSMFESTLGFSASYNPLVRLKPEHMHSTEIAFIQDLRPLLHLNAEGQKADFKLTWYRNVTTHVIDRTTNLLFYNVDKQILSGIEAQARFDTGRFFADLGYAHTFINKVCDQSSATTLDSGHTALNRIPDCVKYGFYGGYLLTQAAPDDSFNANIGARFFKRRLEVGQRFTWFSGYSNPLLSALVGGTTLINGYALNVPYTWGNTLTVDAYVRMRVNDRFTAELDGTNLTDRYYGDPLTRSLNPAPGRTLRLNLTAKL